MSGAVLRKCDACGNGWIGEGVTAHLDPCPKCGVRPGPRWTKERPTKPGWFWFQYSPTAEKEIVCVAIEHRGWPNPQPCLVAKSTDYEWPRPLVEMGGSDALWWSEPLVPPP